MNGNDDVAWLTIRLRERDSGRLTAALIEIVKQAHAGGLRAATIFHAPGDVSMPRLSAVHSEKSHPSISLPDGVGGTVTIADDAERLRDFVAVLGDLVPSNAAIRIDVAHQVYDLSREPADV